MLREGPAVYLERTKEFLRSAHTALQDKTDAHHAVYTNAFMAAKLAGKALLLEAAEWAKRTHEIGGPLQDNGLLPVSLDPTMTKRFFRTWTKARYDIEAVITPVEAERALYIAEKMVEAAGAYPDHPFHPPRSRP